MHSLQPRDNLVCVERLCRHKLSLIKVQDRLSRMVRHPVVAAVTYIVWNFALQPQVFLQVSLSYVCAMSFDSQPHCHDSFV